MVNTKHCRTHIPIVKIWTVLIVSSGWIDDCGVTRIDGVLGFVWFEAFTEGVLWWCVGIVVMTACDGVEDLIGLKFVIVEGWGAGIELTELGSGWHGTERGVDWDIIIVGWKRGYIEVTNYAEKHVRCSVGWLLWTIGSLRSASSVESDAGIWEFRKMLVIKI